MDRRAFLTWVAAGLSGSFAGCTDRTQSDDDAMSSFAEIIRTQTTRTSAATSDQPSGENSSEVTSIAGTSLPIPKRRLTRGAPKDAIPAITEPVFSSDWSSPDVESLQPDDVVIGITREGASRAYPLRVLIWHEVVNDSFGDPLLVSYCPLCGSAVTAKRVVDGNPATFGVSGLLWNSDLVMYDEKTESLWSQIAATGIRGPETGERLSIVPSTLTTWKAWQRIHPETSVLLPPPRSNTVEGPISRNYNVTSSRGDGMRGQTGIGANGLSETGSYVHPKTQVLGITSEGVSKAYPLPVVRELEVVNDVVSDLPVVVTVAADKMTLVAYIRRVNGDILRFETDSERHLRAGDSNWLITTGEAVNGPYSGITLTHATQETQLFWFAWKHFHPDTTLYSPDQ